MVHGGSSVWGAGACGDKERRPVGASGGAVNVEVVRMAESETPKLNAAAISVVSAMNTAPTRSDERGRKMAIWRRRNRRVRKRLAAMNRTRKPMPGGRRQRPRWRRICRGSRPGESTATRRRARSKRVSDEQAHMIAASGSCVAKTREDTNAGLRREEREASIDGPRPVEAEQLVARFPIRSWMAATPRAG